MGRGNLLNSIPELQLEWATRYGSLSVRSFLLEVKGLTERQYRYILQKYDLSTWTRQRQTIETKTRAAQIESYVDKATRSLDVQFKAAQLLFMKITNQIATLSLEKQNANLIAKLTIALADAQAINNKALGLTEESIKRIYAMRESQQGAAQINSAEREAKIANAVQRLDYDDIVDMIKARRRKQRELAATLPKEETEDKP